MTYHPNVIEHIEEVDINSWRLDDLLRPLSEWNPNRERMFESFLLVGLSGDRKIKGTAPESMTAEVIYQHPSKSEYVL